MEEKLYQKYLADLIEWDKKRSEIIGNKDTDGSIEFFKQELNYIDMNLDSEYNTLISNRDDITKRIYEGISELSKYIKAYMHLFRRKYRSCSELLKTAYSFKQKCL